MYSKKAIHLRQWAIKILKNHILKGYTINPERAKLNCKNFVKTADEI
jgi:hypothetical protein